RYPLYVNSFPRERVPPLREAAAVVLVLLRSKQRDAPRIWPRTVLLDGLHADAESVRQDAHPPEVHFVGQPAATLRQLQEGLHALVTRHVSQLGEIQIEILRAQFERRLGWVARGLVRIGDADV